MLRWLAIVVSVVIVGIAGWSLWRQLAGLDPAAVSTALGSLTGRALVVAGGLLAVSYAAYAGLERLASAGVGLILPPGRCLGLAVAAQGISLATGKGLLVAGAVRYRLFKRWGGNLSQAIIATLLVSVHGNAGMLALTGIAIGGWGPWSGMTSLLGAVGAAGGLGAWLWLCARQETYTWRGTTVVLPRPRAASIGIVVGGGEKLACGLLAWTLVPGDPGIACGAFLAVVCVALFLARISQVPGGIGVFEATVLNLWPVPIGDRQAQLVAGLLAFRIAYYLVPLLPGLLTLAFFGWWRRVPPCVTASA